MDAGDSETKCFWKPRTNQTTNFDDYRDQINNKFGLNLGKFLSSSLKTKPPKCKYFQFVMI